MAFLKKSLFSSFFVKPQPTTPDLPQDEPVPPAIAPFSISLTSFLEALQIFGLSELTKSSNQWERDTMANGAFSAQTLGVSGVCRLRYDRPGSPLQLVLEETGITTSCELVTYEPSALAEIPFSRDELTLKAIVGAPYLHDAIIEMSATNPDRIIISASNQCLVFSAPNDHGAVTFQFYRDGDKYRNEELNRSTAGAGESIGKVGDMPSILETFMVAEQPFRQAYKFSHIAATRKALSSAIKVSIRGDHQGVLSLQFMIEIVDGEPGVSFVDFLFIPLVEEENENVEQSQLGMPDSF
jgi:cell cycle checkpoint protein